MALSDDAHEPAPLDSARATNDPRLAQAGELADGWGDGLGPAPARLPALLAQLAVVVLLIEPGTGAIADANEAAADFYGYPLDLLRTMSIQQVALDPQVAGVPSPEPVVGPGHVVRVPHRLSDGEVRIVDVHSSSVSTSVGPMVLAVVIDVTPQAAAEAALQERGHRFRMIAESASDVVYQTDTAGVIGWISPSIRSVLGWDPDALVGTPARDLIDPRDWELFDQGRAGLSAGHERGAVEMRYRHTTGGTRYMSETARPLVADSGQVTGAVVALVSLSRERQVRAELARSQDQFRLAMTNAPQGMIIADSVGRFTQVNPAMCRLLGLPPEQLLGRTLEDFVPPDEAHVTQGRAAILDSGSADSVTHHHHLVAAGKDLWVEHSTSVLRNEKGLPLFYVHQFSDQTQARELSQALAHRASHDALTGLANRDNLMTTLRRTLDRPQRRSREGNHTIGVLFADVDNLKAVNDSFGHRAGDAVLTFVANRVAGAVRQGDLVSRVSGDEFVVVLDHTGGLADIRTAAEKIRRAIAGSLEFGEAQIPVSVSIGITVADPGEDPEQVLSRADRALYRAKQAGRNTTRG